MDRLGFEVRQATNGREALDIWEKWVPHLVWMDLRMPIMDGYEATRRIKSDPHSSATIVIVLTATAFKHDQPQIMASGCDDFLTKPFEHVAVFQMLQKHLGIELIYDDKPE